MNNTTDSGKDVRQTEVPTPKDTNAISVTPDEIPRPDDGRETSKGTTTQQ